MAVNNITSHKRNILYLLCVAFFMSFIAGPPIDLLNSNLELNISRADDGSDTTKPLHRLSMLPFTDITDHELIADQELSYTIRRSPGASHSSFYRLLLAPAFPLVSLLILLYYKKLTAWKGDRQIPLLAISKGGHAPPLLLF